MCKYCQPFFQEQRLSNHNSNPNILSLSLLPSPFFLFPLSPSLSLSLPSSLPPFLSPSLPLFPSPSLSPSLFPSLPPSLSPSLFPSLPPISLPPSFLPLSSFYTCMHTPLLPLYQEWWTHLWLKEGFASWIEYLCVDHCHPEYDIWTQFVTADFSRAMELDALRNR